ncbi:hypothetical protein Afil01_42710 [Actinorhabdospora filicis]|uniref:Uncharacterized protein n=1 Tax=Actinorhabdospora filicis TaxID=1785913 RepID=A0A9W6SP60_9ACTN|nr:hypothetical protein [Actinorhabdospora filicis]GLZ79464.1 hypothetical protein Afil01_42710 [Actinorhabdospora filicis]
MAKIIMAVGRGRGPYYAPDKPEKKDPEYYEIVAGSQVGEFTYEQATVWAAAHDRFDAQARHEFNREQLEKVARETYKISNPGSAVDFLLSEGVLVEVDLETEIPTEFFKRYRLIPTGTCAGNIPDRRDLYRLVVGEASTVVNRQALGIWTYSYLHGSIWEGCKSLSKAFRKRGKDAPPEAFANEVAIFLPAIVAIEAGVVEPVA